MDEKWPVKFSLTMRLPRHCRVFLTCRKAATWDRRPYFPSEGRHAEDFFARKIRRLRPDLDPRTWVPEAKRIPYSTQLAGFGKFNWSLPPSWEHDTSVSYTPNVWTFNPIVSAWKHLAGICCDYATSYSLHERFLLRAANSQLRLVIRRSWSQ
jgi:hypothetical protein